MRESSSLRLDDQLAYTSELDDDWQHLCTVGPKQIELTPVCDVVPDRPSAH